MVPVVPVVCLLSCAVRFKQICKLSLPQRSADSRTAHAQSQPIKTRLVCSFTGRHSHSPCSNHVLAESVFAGPLCFPFRHCKSFSLLFLISLSLSHHCEPHFLIPASLTFSSQRPSLLSSPNLILSPLLLCFSCLYKSPWRLSLTLKPRPAPICLSSVYFSLPSKPPWPTSLAFACPPLITLILTC